MCQFLKTSIKLCGVIIFFSYRTLVLDHFLFYFHLEYSEVGDKGVSVFLVHSMCRRHSHCSRSRHSEVLLPVYQ